MAVYIAVVNNGLESCSLDSLEVFILGHYGPPSTGRIQQLANNSSHNQGATKMLLHNYLLMVTVENDKKIFDFI